MKSLARVLLVAAAITVVTPALARAELKFVMTPRLAATELSQMFTPLVQYLTKEAGEQVTLVIPKDFDTMKQMVRTGQVDVGFTNPLIYIQLRREVGIEPLAVSAETTGAKMRGVIIARKDSGINVAADLKGKRLIFVDKDSAAGCILQLRLLSMAGLERDRDFTVLPFPKTQANVALAVYNKAADAGAMREEDVEKMKDRIDLSQVKIVAYTDYIPNQLVFAKAGLAQARADKVRKALLKLRMGSSEAGAVLNSAQLTGFTSVTDKDYDEFRQAAKAAGAF